MGEICLAPSNNACLTPGNPITNLPKKEEYLLQVQDSLGGQLKAMLVVLNVCFAAGEISPEDVNGLARAFLAAGARAVLLAL